MGQYSESVVLTSIYMCPVSLVDLEMHIGCQKYNQKNHWVEMLSGPKHTLIVSDILNPRSSSPWNGLALTSSGSGSSRRSSGPLVLHPPSRCRCPGFYMADAGSHLHWLAHLMEPHLPGVWSLYTGSGPSWRCRSFPGSLGWWWLCWSCQVHASWLGEWWRCHKGCPKKDSWRQNGVKFAGPMLPSTSQKHWRLGVEL